MSSNKTIVHEFDPKVYPFRLWVGKKVPFEYVKENFWELDTEKNRCEFERERYERNQFIIATCYPVADKHEGWIGILMVIHRPSCLDIETIAHECSHITDYLCDTLGLEGYSFEQGEPRAYFTGWCAKCIDKVRKIKEVKNGCESSKSSHNQEGEPKEACEEAQESR